MDRLKEMLKNDTEIINAISSPTEEKEENVEYAEITAYSLEEALEKAAKKLNASIADLEYTILEKGKSGFLGIGKKPFRILVKRTLPEVPPEVSALLQKTKEAEKRKIDRDGSFKIRVKKSGIFLTVYPPEGRGRKIGLQEVLNGLYARSIQNYDAGAVERAVKEAKGEPVKIGEWTPNPEYDGKMALEITEDEMKVYLTLYPPRKYGRIVEPDDVLSELQKRGVVFGIKEDVIKEAIEKDKYNQPILIAEGIPAKDGEDAKVDYKFRIEKEVQFEEDESGRIDFKSLDLVENVVVGQVLAVKVPATKGQIGKTVTGKEIPAKDGKDINLAVYSGKGTRLTEDGMQIVAEINGQVVYTKGKVSVEPVYEVKGDVNLETGNIVFLGTVVVWGNVEDGFSVKAAGNIEVKGNVGKAQLEAEGDIIIKQGLLGKDEAEVIAGNDIIAKFIERAKRVEAGRDVIVAEGIMHSYVDAGKRVICNGRRAIIVGGRIRAGEEVNAKVLGSPSYTPTEIEVGIDPKARQQLMDLLEEQRQLKEELRELSMNITTLENQKRAGGGRLSPEREEMLLNMIQRREEITPRLEEIDEQIAELRSFLATLEEKGKICVQNVVHPRVKIVIKDANLEVRDPFKYVTFVQEGGNIKVLPYQEAKVTEKKFTGRRR